MAAVLVTGAAGFIGQHLVAALADRHDVYGLGRGARPEATPPAVQWLLHDLTAPALPGAMPSRVDTVVHLAQSQQYRRFPVAVSDVFDVNLRATMLLLDWAQRTGAHRFVLLSTGGVSGTGERPLREDQPYVGAGPLAFYFATKYSAEILAHSFSSLLSDVILRPFFVYGPNQKPNMLMPRLIARITRGEPVSLQGAEGIHLNPVHVDDCVRAIEASFALDGSHVINVAGPEVLSLRNIAETIGGVLGRPPVFEYDEKARPGHMVADISRMRAVLAPPTIAFADGIRGLCRPVAGR